MNPHDTGNDSTPIQVQLSSGSNTIASLCTISNKLSIAELEIMLKSFRLYHCDIPIYVGGDSFTCKRVEKWHIRNVTTKRMIPDDLRPAQNCPAWLKLMLKKTDIMDVALDECGDTLFVDADMLFLHSVVGIAVQEREVALSPHYINREDEKKYGRYNGGYVWTSEKVFPQWWRDTTPGSTYYEQQALVHAPTIFATQELKPNHNQSWWRLDQVGPKERGKRRKLFKVNGGVIMYDRWPLVSVHTHILDKGPKCASINKLTKSLLKQSTSGRHKTILELIKGAK